MGALLPDVRTVIPRAARPTRACLLAVVAATAVLGGCTSYGPSRVAPGQSTEEVTQAMGMPTARYALADGGARLEFARGPFGKHTYMVDVDANGRVRQWRQVLTEANFDAVRAGIPAQELLQTLGTPSHRRGGGWQGGEVWSWRYQATFCQWFQASVIDGRVRDTGYGPDPVCDVDDDRYARWRVR